MTIISIESPVRIGQDGVQLRYSENDLMIVIAGCEYHSQFLFQPLRRNDDTLHGIELITWFSTQDGVVNTPEALLSLQMSPAQKQSLFCEKIALIQQYQHLFAQYDLQVLLHIDEDIACFLFSSPMFVKAVSSLPFLHLLIDESFTDISAGRDNALLLKLSQRFSLGLANYGSGGLSGRAVLQGLFKYIMLDKNFVHTRARRLSFSSFLYAIVNQVGPCCQALCISGVDSQSIRQLVSPMTFSAMQGALWPAIDAALLPQWIAEE